MGSTAIPVKLHIEITGPVEGQHAEILTAAGVEFISGLARKFEQRRQQLLENRQARQKEIDAGRRPAFLPETASVRDSAWGVAPIPKDPQDRRVEITGPVGRKLAINALNSGANVFMADFVAGNPATDP